MNMGQINKTFAEFEPNDLDILGTSERVKKPTDKPPLY